MHNIDTSLKDGILTITIDLKEQKVSAKGRVVIASTEGEVEMLNSGIRLQLYLYRIGGRKYGVK